MTSAKIIVLIVSIVMPGQQPDMNKIYPLKSFDECWMAAKDFTERDLTDDMRSHGAIGLKAACGYLEKPSDPS